MSGTPKPLPRELTQGFSRAAVEALSEYKQEPSWMTDLRLAAWDIYAQSPLSPESIGFSLQAIQPFMAPPSSPIPSHEWPGDLQHALEERGDEEGLIVQRDSTILSRSITKEHSKKGVIFTDLDTAIQTVPELVQRYFGQLAKLESPFNALNTAFWSGGTFLYVPEYLDIQLPFHTCLWMSAPGVGTFPRSVIVIERGSTVSFIDEGVSADRVTPALSVGSVETFIGAQARVSYFHLQHWGTGVHQHQEEKARVAPSGQLTFYRLDMGGQQPRNLLALLSAEDAAWRMLAETPFEDVERLETIFQQVPITSVAEKLRGCIEGWRTGHRPPLTLQRVAELHPEVRS